MPVLYRITVVEERPPDVTVRAWRAIKTAAHAKQGKHWHRKFVKKHFRPGAANKYGYRPRSRKWVAKKIALAKRAPHKFPQGGRVPLVFTGETERSIRQVAIVRAYPTRCTIEMHGPRHVTMTPRGNRPWLAKEITTVSDDEVKELDQLLDDETTQGLAKIRTKKTTRLH